jgi:hypothetical protein
MVNAVELLRQGRRDEFWQRYCGFLDLSVDEFMDIQERLLTEQLHLLAASELGRKILGGPVPLTPNEFRRVAPITTYGDYAQFFLEQREDVLPVKPASWLRTSGTSGEYPVKWVPASPTYYSHLAKGLITVLTLSSAKFRGDIALAEGDTLLYTAAPPPYLTGAIMHAYPQEFPFKAVPPVDLAEKMTFEERIQQGFFSSMGSGIDYFIGIASVLMRMGEVFGKGARHTSLSPELLHPAAIYQLGKAFVASRLNGRAMLPKDIWRPKGIVASGMDVQVYKNRIEELWGRAPLEAYGCTDGLTMVPEDAFWEFMPESEYHLWRQDHTRQPKTLLLSEVQPGKYVLVGTSLAGGAFIRYILGDLVRVVALADEKLGIRLPQIIVESRVDGVISLGSMVNFTERTLWTAMGALNVGTISWTARKEYSAEHGEPLLHMCIESEGLEPERFRSELHEALIETDMEYFGFYDVMRTNPIRISVLTPGTFHGYLAERQAQGADLGQLKPPRMQPTDQTIKTLLAISARLNGGTR